jgi:hypothetical protein
MVLLARADMRPLLDDMDRVEAGRFGGLPPYPSASDASAVKVADGEVKSTQVVFDTADKPEQVLAFYRKAFDGAEVRDPTLPKGTVLFRMDDGDWRISARADKASKLTLVSAIHGRAERPVDDEGGPR